MATNKEGRGHVLRFHSKEEECEAARIREALQSVARQLSFLVRYAEQKGREGTAIEVARICADVVALTQRVKP